MQRDETDLPQEKPGVPCVVCGKASHAPPILGRWQLCPGHIGEFFADTRFHGGDLASNTAAAPGWLAEKRAELQRGAA